MQIYAQHGYGKTDKLQQGLQEGSISGVVLSPRDEMPANLEALAKSIRGEFKGAEVLMDPQFYVSTLNSPRDGQLPEYTAYYKSGLTRSNFVSPTSIQRMVKNTLDYQMRLGLTRLLSPTVLFEDFRDPWSQVSLSLAQASIDYHGQLNDPPPLLISLAFSETALPSMASLNEFLDVISLWEIEGFYVIARRVDSQYQTTFAPDRLANLLYLVYSLAKLNDFEVVCGYSDLVGTLLHGVGATATCAGWHGSLRQFSLSRFQPKTGGAPPRPRYTSGPLLNSILVSELDNIGRAGHLRDVLSGTAHDKIFATSKRIQNESWPLEKSTLHHWAVLKELAERVSSGKIPARLDACSKLIAGAAGLYTKLQKTVPFDTSTGEHHLADWKEALAAFRAAVSV